jgi:hypothetical protein
MISPLVGNFVFFVAKFFSSRHKDTKTLRTNNKLKSFVSLCLGGKYFLVSGFIRIRIFNPTNPVHPVKKIYSEEIA